MALQAAAWAGGAGQGRRVRQAQHILRATAVPNHMLWVFMATMSAGSALRVRPETHVI